MKTSEIQKYLVGTTSCMNRLSISNKGCGQLTSNYTYYSDSWFSSVKTSKEAMAAEVDYCGPLNTSHKYFFLSTLERFKKYWPGG